jgi:outer membrane biosynthesis protein TonB
MWRAVVVLGLLLVGSTAAHAQPKGVVTKSPKLLQAVAPEYPPAALAAGKTAKVKVKIHIDENGIVTKVDVLEPVGDGFD